MFALIQIGLVVLVITIVVGYVFRRQQEDRPRDELELRAQFYRKEVMNFLRRLHGSPSKVLQQRLEREIQHFHRAATLDQLLERAEQDENPRSTIDKYLEALNYLMQQGFETDRKPEIEDRIKRLQEQLHSPASYSRRG
jgi:hypothetical protein